MLNVTKTMMMTAVAVNLAGVMGLVYPTPLAEGTTNDQVVKTTIVNGRASTPLADTAGTPDSSDEALVFALPEYVLLCGTAAALVSLPGAKALKKASKKSKAQASAPRLT